MADEASRWNRVHRGRVFLACHLVVNALLITYVAISHTFTRDLPKPTYWEGVLQQHQVFVEALLLTLPGWIVGAAAGRWLPRLGTLLGAVLITFSPVFYYGDLVSYLTVGDRLLSANTLQLIASVIPLLSDYTMFSSYSSIVIAVAIWAAVEVISLLASWNVSAYAGRSEVGGRRALLAVALAVIAVPLGFRLARPGAVIDEMRRHSERHPISAARIVGHVRPELPESTPAERVRFQSHLLARQGKLEELRQRYRELAVTAGPTRPLDTLVLIVESFRSDAVNLESAPNLSRLREGSLSSRLHFSGGNSSNVGFYTLLFGLDSAFYAAAAEEWPAALPRLFHQAGYYRAFMGTGPFEWQEMNKFLNADAFEFFHLDTTLPYYERDRRLIVLATQIFQRKPPFEELADKPVFIALYLHTTHYPYHVAPGDKVFAPALDGNLPPPPWDAKTRPLVWNRYLNSVRTLDRLIEPLLDPERLIVVVGDHGEAFHEDGTIIHGSKLSFVQTRTPLIVQAPGGECRELSGPTTHADVLPTLLDALGLEVNHPGVFSGRSLLADEESRQSLPFGLRNLAGGEYALYGAHSSGSVPSRFFHFHLDLWEPEFSVVGAFDELARPVDACRENVEAFEADVTVWLGRLLREEGAVVAADPLPELMATVTGSDMIACRKALGILRAMGPNAKAAIPGLEQFLRGQNASATRKDVVDTLVAIRSGG